MRCWLGKQGKEFEFAVYSPERKRFLSCRCISSSSSSSPRSISERCSRIFLLFGSTRTPISRVMPPKKSKIKVESQKTWVEKKAIIAGVGGWVGAGIGGGVIKRPLQCTHTHTHDKRRQHFSCSFAKLHQASSQPHQRWYMQKWKLSRNTCTLHTRFCTLGADLHAQSALSNKIFASELTRKFIKSALLVGLVLFLLPGHEGTAVNRSLFFFTVCNGEKRIVFFFFFASLCNCSGKTETVARKT